MKYFIVADVHSFYDEMMDALEEKGFDQTNEEHTFVSLGDLLDRGGKPRACLRFVNGLERKILVRGNHEDLLEDIFARGYFLDHDLHNGTDKTVYNLGDYGLTTFTVKDAIDNTEQDKDLKKYLRSLVDYGEVGNNIFVHGWIPCNVKYYQHYMTLSPIEDWKHGDWYEARWLNGIDAWNRGIRVDDKTVFCGHWHCSWGWSHLRNQYKEFPQKTHKDFEKSFEPFIDDGIVALDACTAYSNKVNCFVLEV